MADLAQTDFGEPAERLEVAASSDRGGTVRGLRDDASGAPGRLCDYWLKRQLHVFFLKAEPGDIPRCLAAGAELEMADSEGLTALHIAARYAGNPDVLSWLIEAGADVETRTTGEDPRTALYFAARYNRSVDAVQRLIDLGADVNARAERGVMPLHVAALHNRNPAVVAHASSSAGRTWMPSPGIGKASAGKASGPLRGSTTPCGAHPCIAASGNTRSRAPCR